MGGGDVAFSTDGTGRALCARESAPSSFLSRDAPEDTLPESPAAASTNDPNATIHCDANPAAQTQPSYHPYDD
eukprot:2563081-Pleurochrysis_carterae.AAC.1